MLTVGLTGNIGSGKSLVSEIFSTFGVPVYHADQESKKFLAAPQVRTKIIERFGEKTVSPSGEIDRTELAKIVFSDEKALLALNSILHPLVIGDFWEWRKAYGLHPYIIQEAAIIFESGIAALFDKIIHVSCPKEIAIARVIKRDGTDGNSVRQRMRYQMEDEEKAALSDFVIRNDGTGMLLPQVLFIHEQILQISANGNNKEIVNYLF
ncbi:MAG: dephospho-CoA kinase [Bacteroidetes bacterium]|nr:dephospho-CoA kinase [Bacteroidota bacterium]